jgi:hypothetical protein
MPDLRVSFPKPCDETWEAMTPSGCDRVCARCDHVVHDLSQYTLAEAEALLGANPGSCVRAQIGADGAVALKPGRGGKAGRMMIAVAATAGLLAAAAPAYARQERPAGAISGAVESYGSRTRVTATGRTGQTFRARVKENGRFRLRHLPPDTYTITFRAACGETVTVENVVVRDAETVLPGVQEVQGCIVIGLLRIEDHRADG